jgi:phage terminase small subunit
MTVMVKERRLTQKQETFCLVYFKTGNASKSAITAGYSSRVSRVIACENLAKPNIQARLRELRQKVEDASVMNVQERKQRLTEIARARLTDFMEMGQDGTWVNIGPEVPMTGAIQEMSSRTEYDDDGAKPTVHTKVKLHSPIAAIDLLNKMDRIYSDGTQVNVDNRRVEIHVYDRETKALVQRLVDGETPQADSGIQR